MRVLVLSLFYVSAMILPFFRCTEPEVKPRMVIPGYRSKLLFQEEFDGNLAHWSVEGKGKLEVTEDNRLLVTSTPESEGIAVWTVQDFSGDFHLEYEVELPETAGINLAFICARGIRDEDILKELPPRNGNLNEYTRGQIRNYHIAYHCYTPEGQHASGSRVRKNPGFMLLSSTDDDPCKENRPYFINIVKIDNRIQFFVDNQLIHDVRDKGGFGPTYMNGKIGFWVHGAENMFRTIFDSVRVFKLIPK